MSNINLCKFLVITGGGWSSLPIIPRAGFFSSGAEDRRMDLPQECFHWWTLGLGIINRQVSLPCRQMCSNMKLEDSVMKADRRNWLRTVFKDRPRGTIWFCYPCRLSYHVPS